MENGRTWEGKYSQKKTDSLLPFWKRNPLYIMAPETGLEPVTHRLTADCATIAPLRNGIY